MSDEGNCDDAVVGYRKPPKANQFKKGQSGNPRGRPPKKAANVSSAARWGVSVNAIRRLAYEPVMAMLNGEPTAIPLIEAVHRRRLNDAAKGGNRLLQREVIAEANAQEQQLLEYEAERFVRLQNTKAKGEALIAQARSQRLPEPELVPHPDDIMINEEEFIATVDGPETRKDLALVKFNVAVRNHCVLQAMYQKRFPPLLAPFTQADFDGWRACAEAMNESLCQRLRWGQFGFWSASRAYERKGYRFLEADLEASLANLAGIWANEPALEGLRTNKKFARLFTKLLAFKPRSRERVIWHRNYNDLKAAMRLIHGDHFVDQLPKRLPMRSYTESMAIMEAVSKRSKPS